ncbi:unnamed protein product [Arctia plantaginis]|uniref:Flavin-containing monooxygenase n=1 Tax=Arctia plantaginis TaxID=874455 RepID=A0A8S0YZZ2_ARCPL|nr:unnamed protein product [Arctia plantaginis]
MASRMCVTILCLLNVFFGVVDVSTEPVSDPRVCIIGAGYSGLGAARHMQDYGLNFTVFEATRYIGGTWRFDPRVGTDEDGLPLFTSAYKNMRTNTITQTMEYSGFPFPEGTSSYLTGDCVYKYLLSFTNHFDLIENIQFQSLVTKVQWEDDIWNVMYMKTDTRENITEHCNFVVVATGEYSSPNVPHFEGQEEFKGKIIHSHDYKDAEDFRNLTVLVVGAGPSGLDVAIQLVNVTSKLLHSHHFMYKLPEIYGNYLMKPDIKHFNTTGAVFVDGSTEEFDIVILCTGYTFSFPFLNYQSAGVSATKKYVLPLHNQVVNINHPSMTFVGVSKYVPGIVRDIQGQYSAALAAGYIKLPSQEDMFQQWFDHAKDKPLTDVNVVGNTIYADYLEGLLENTPIPQPPRILATLVANTSRDWYEDLLKFRDNQYTLISDNEYEKMYKPTEKICLVD